jgi:hypothetical protein
MESSEGKRFRWPGRCDEGELVEREVGDRAFDREVDFVRFSRRGGGCLRRPMKTSFGLGGEGVLVGVRV